MRQAVKVGLYLFFVDLVAVFLVWSPVEAFIISSTTGYSRVVTQAAQTAYIASHRAQIISQLAPAVTAASAGSVAIRAVAGPIGWASIGVSAGLVIAGMVYDSSEIAQVKSNAATAAGLPNEIQVNGQTMPSGSAITFTNCDGGLYNGCIDVMLVPNGLQQESCTGTSSSPPSGWTAQSRQWSSVNGGATACYDNYRWTYNGSNLATRAASVPGTPTAQHVSDYLTSLPSGNALAPESQNQPAGTTNPTPTGTTTVDLPVSPVEMPTTVKPSNQGATGDAVVNPNAQAPIQTTDTSTQSTTTTTTTNQDGSTTSTDTASVQCNAGEHDQRTFGSILQSHYDVWSASGLVGTLNLIKNLTWPETLPTYTLTSTIFGTMTFNFNSWSGIFTALRTLIIAAAGFVAYRIIFIGGK